MPHVTLVKKSHLNLLSVIQYFKTTYLKKTNYIHKIEYQYQPKFSVSGFMPNYY